MIIAYAGLAKSTAKVADPKTQGFINQTPGVGRIPYTGGELSFPVGEPLMGVFTATLATVNGPVVVKFPLAPGSVKPGFVNFGPAGTASTFGPVTGTSYMSPNSTFFYANLTPVAPALASNRGFIFGGQPVPSTSPLLTTAPGQPQLYTFALQQDAALQSPIPFITQSTGGNIANPSVSPLYVVAPGQSVFGSFNAKTNPNVTAPHTLQASLAINGAGASQSSALVVQTGAFFTSSDNGAVVADGVIRGSYLANGTSPPVQIRSGAATVPNGNGGNIFGTGTGSLPISGFVLDQNQYNTSDNFVPNKTAVQTPLGGTSSNYAFNQPATPTVTPSTQFGVRTPGTTTYSGSFGGIMYPVVGGKLASPYAATGTTSVTTDATNNRVAATFTGADAFNAKGATLAVQFGSITGNGRSRSAFVDNARYAALENPVTPSQVNGVNIRLNGDPTQASQIALVSSGVVSNNLLPSGGLCAQCQFLQWGYWTGTLDTPNAAETAVVRQDAAHINTWVAGIPSITLPATGTGSFSGNALGSVVNGGASYLAAGQFTNTYNFGTHTGAFAINNFDTRSFKGTVTGVGAGYSGALTGPAGFGGSANGTFFGNIPGNPATETGGNFALKGPAYLASGVFAGIRGGLVP